MSNIFISYRHSDSQHVTDRIYDQLSARFPDRKIFRDIDYSIPLGHDFRERIASEISHCSVLLAVIGPRWLAVDDSRGGPRLNDPNDFVRAEIESAFQHGITVIPLLVEGASIPRAQNLPPSLHELPFCQGMAIRSGSDFPRDIDGLVSELERLDRAAMAHKFHVLLVEESDLHQKFAAEVLAQSGHTCLKASNDADALAVLEREPIALVLLQARMSSTDGCTIFAKIRNAEPAGGPRVPVLAMTNEPEQRAKCFAAGMDGCLSRPLRAPELRNAISRLMNTIDFDSALARLGGDMRLFDVLVGHFNEDHGEFLKRIRDGLTSSDYDSIARGAHAMKGFAAVFGAHRLVAAAAAIENAAQQRADLATIMDLWPEFQSQVDKLIVALTSTLRMQRQENDG